MTVVILSNTVLISLSMYVCLSADFRRCKRLQQPSNPGACNMFPAQCARVTNMSLYYNISPHCEDMSPTSTCEI